MSKNNKWEALSMRDRAFLIRQAVRNGVTDIDSIRDTWEHRFDGENNVGYKTHNDPLLSDPESFNGRFTDLRSDAVLEKEYYNSVDLYDPTNLHGRLGLSPAQIVRDQTHLADLRTVELKARDPYKVPSFVGDIRNSDDIADYLSNTIPKPTLEETRAMHNLGSSQKQLLDTVKGFYDNTSAAGMTTTRTKDDTAGMIVYNERNFSPSEGLDENNTKVHERHHFRSHTSDSPFYTSNRANPYSRNGWLYEFDADRLLIKPESTQRLGTNSNGEVTSEKYYLPNIKYKYDPEEIDARIKSVQFSNKLDPTHVYTQQDLEAMRKDPNFQWHNTENLRDDVFLDRLNHTFSGEEDKENNDIDVPSFSSLLNNNSKTYLQNIISPKVPFKHSTEEPSAYQKDILKQYVAGISDITEAVHSGSGDLYLYNGETEDKDPYSVFLKAKGMPYFYKVQKRYLDTIPMEHFDIIAQKDLRKYMPKRDYIGSNAKTVQKQNEEVREKVARLIPGFIDSLSVIAGRHKINPSLMYRRISKEGYLDHKAKLYNEVIPTIEQSDFWDNSGEQEVSGFDEFGLDDIRDILEANQLKLTKPVQWRPDEYVRHNEKDRRVYSAYFPTLWDALEVKAAELARRKEIMKQRGYSGQDLDIWTNASYNLGPEHEDLKDTEWIRKTYSFPNYSHLFKK